ncbi:MAG TPA: murein biosynthesis integral membrane protein MurJ [Gemmatimonadaceae bacterium]|nr:murein biosynthesis integral membrane protein MurJ [Gemmatimonadaceae bacterium]
MGATPAGDAAADTPAPPTGDSGGRFAFLVAAGIFLSRIAGLIRQRVFAFYFGNSAAADAFSAAFRIPNLLQNLFGEGVLSASFIPVYSRLLARGDGDEARRLAGGVLALLAFVTSVLVLLGVLATPLLIDLIAPGFSGAKRELTIRLVRIFFPGAGLLVLSAWCLGILNSHRRFFLSYVAPVIWNAAIIVALLVGGTRLVQDDLAITAAWASVAGSLLQILVQLPAVIRILGSIPLTTRLTSEHQRAVTRNFVPVFVSRGIVQISAYIDQLLASLLPTGAVAALYYAQILYTLPVSLFGMAVSAAELPAMASAVGQTQEVATYLRGRLTSGLRRIALFTIPSAVAFLALGDVVAGTLYETGSFTRGDSIYVWGILAGSALGLVPATFGRLYASTFYALHDTRTPFRFALVRVVLTTGLGYVAALHLPDMLGIDRRWGAAGITLASGIAAWVELALLRRALEGQVGVARASRGPLIRLWLAAGAAAAVAWAVRLALPTGTHPVLLGIFVLGAYGVLYFLLAAALGVDDAAGVVRRVVRLAGRGRN